MGDDPGSSCAYQQKILLFFFHRVPSQAKVMLAA